jgi:hypothetical protein
VAEPKAREPQVLGHERVDEPNRVQDFSRPQPLQVCAPPEIGAAGAVISVPVHDEHEGLLKRRHEKYRRVRVVMPDVDDRR